MAIEKATLVRRPSSPPPPRVETTLGGVLRRRNIQILGPITAGKMNGLNISSPVAERLERMLGPVKYFALAKGTNISDLNKALRSEDLNKFAVRGRLFLCLGAPGSIFPPLERSLKDFKDASKRRDFMSAAESGLRALAVAEGEELGAARQEILARLKGGLDDLAEQYVQRRNPMEITALFLELGDKDLNLEMLSKLARLSTNELKAETADRSSPAFKKFLKKEGIRPLLLEAFDKMYPLESEAEFALKMAEAFPAETAYVRQLIDLELKAGDLKDAQEHIRVLRESGQMDLELWQRVDRLRGLLIAEELAKHPDLKIFLERSFEKLVSGKITAGEYEAVKTYEIGLEYFIEKCLELSSTRRMIAYRTISKLSEIVKNGEERRVTEVKQGIFGRILSDAIRGIHLPEEEKELLSDFSLLRSYQRFNPARAEQFVSEIREKLLEAQASRAQSPNNKVLKLIYKFLVLEPKFEGKDELLKVDFEDGNPPQEISVEEASTYGWAMVAFGFPDKALNLVRSYSKLSPTCELYEIELAALLEQGNFALAERLFAAIRPVLGPEEAGRFARALNEKKLYKQVEADDNLNLLIIERTRVVDHQGRRHSLRKFEESKLNRVLGIATFYQSTRKYVFKKLTDIFLAQAQSLEGASVVLGLLAGILYEQQKEPEKLKPIDSEILTMLRLLNRTMTDTFAKDLRIAGEVLGDQINVYGILLKQGGHEQEYAKFKALFLSLR